MSRYCIQGEHMLYLLPLLFHSSLYYPSNLPPALSSYLSKQLHPPTCQVLRQLVINYFRVMAAYQSEYCQSSLQKQNQSYSI